MSSTDIRKKPPFAPKAGYQSPSTSFSGSVRKDYYWNRSGCSTPASITSGTSRYSTSNVGCFSAVKMTAAAKLSRFFRRLVHIRQMDFEFAAWQMIYLLINPQNVYRNFMYRKKSKDQWARDDPAFLVLLAFSLLGSSVLFALALNLSFSSFCTFFLWVVFVDCVGIGTVIATALWINMTIHLTSFLVLLFTLFISNRYLRRTRDCDMVEWAYCFDVHLNAFFPLLVLLHVVLPLLFYGLIDYENLLARFFGNSIWCIATIYYNYITFLGYTALPTLKNTQLFLYPITFLFIFFVAATSAGWNISTTAMDFYHFRVTSANRRG